MIINIEKTLNRMADKDMICRSSIDTIVTCYGLEAKVTKRILQKAINDRGMDHFLNFFTEALGWPETLRDHLHKMQERILWGTKYRLMPWSSRCEIVRRAYVAAVLAYSKEMDKP